MKARSEIATNSRLSLSDAKADDFVIYVANSNQGILMGTNSNSSTLVVLNNNVGINNSAPKYNLDINGDINFTGTLRSNGIPFIGGGDGTTSDVVAQQIAMAASNVAFPLSNFTYNILSNEVYMASNNTLILQTNMAYTNTNTLSPLSNLTYGLLSNAAISASNITHKQWKMGGENSLFYDTGSVGIGTSNPLTSLHIEGSTRSTKVMIGTSLDASRLLSALDSNMVNNTSRSMTIGKVNTPSNQAEITYVHAGDNNAMNRLDIDIMGQTIPPLCVLANGRVGINSSNPDHTLEVVGNINIKGGSILSNGAPLVMGWTMNGANVVTLSNVGIGTNTPSYRLDVVGTTRTSNLLIGTSIDTTRFISALDSNMTNNSSRSIAFGKSNSSSNQARFTYTHIGDRSNNRLDIDIAGQTTPPLSVLANGRVGINSINPAFTLDVVGVSRATQLLLGNSTDNATGDYHRFISALDGNMVNNARRIIAFGKANSRFNQAELMYMHIGDGDERNTFSLGFHSSENIKLTGDGSANIANTTFSKTSHFMKSIYPSLPNFTNYMFSFGQSDSVGNQAELKYYWEYDGSPNNQLILGFHSKENMNITADGRIGIGTSNPQYKLHVEGDINFTGGLYMNGYLIGNVWNPVVNGTIDTPYNIDVFGSTKTKKVYIGTSTDTSADRFITALDSSMRPDDSRYITFGFDNSFMNQAELKYYHGSTLATRKFSLGFYGSENITMLADGRVGISKPNPQYTLDVNGDIGTVGNIMVSGCNTGGITWSNNTDFAKIYYDTQENDSGTLYITTGDNGNEAIVFGTFGGQWWNQSRTGFTERMRIDVNSVTCASNISCRSLTTNRGSISCGEINTNSCNITMGIGSITMDKSYSKITTGEVNCSILTSTDWLKSSLMNSSNMFVSQYLTVGQTFVDTSYNLIVRSGSASNAVRVFGHIVCSGEVWANKYNTNSDVRLKQNIEPIPNALDLCCKLTGYTFYTIDNITKRSMGLIAQEANEVVPEVVNMNDNGYYGIEYANLVALLIESIKELRSKNEMLESRIHSLESRFNSNVN